MLFDKDNNGTQELKDSISFLSAAIDFKNIKTDVELSEEQIIELIGQAVFDRAQVHYDSGDYPDGVTPTQELNTQLVHYIQLPNSIFAYKSYASTRELSHSDRGRKRVHDPDTEARVFEWEIERDDRAILRKAYSSLDRLITFLDKNQNNIPEWKNSDAQKLSRSLFIYNAKIFNHEYPIDNSRRFFIKIVPFINEVERKHIKPVLTTEIFDLIKSEMQTGIFTGDNEEILSLIRPALAQLSMSISIDRLTISTLPEGVYRNVTPQGKTAKAKTPAVNDVRREVSIALQNEGMESLQALIDYLAKKAADLAEETYEYDSITDHNDETNKYFRA